MERTASPRLRQGLTDVLRAALFVAGKDVQYMLRRRETLLWVFVMPIVFFFFIGTITGGFGSGGTSPTRIVVDADSTAGLLAERLAMRLEGQEYVVVGPQDDPEREFSRRLRVPAAFTDSVLAGVRTKVEYEHRGEGMGASYENVRAGRAVYAVLADLVVARERPESTLAAAFAELDATPRALTLDVKSAGKKQLAPTGFEQAIPGTMVMFILLVMTTSGAIMLVVEREQGLLRRLASAPMSRLAVVVGKLLGKFALGVVQIAFAMGAGSALFGMRWGADLPMVIVVLLAYGVLTAGIGVLLGSLARSEGQAAAVGVISSNVLAALGGCWWPIEITPEWMQKLQLFLPTGITMDAMHRLVTFGAGAASALPHLAVILALAAAVTALAARVFRFE
ncbi:MAG: ABC transporter permease [Candidatus Eiseniibacteriota bacterium]